MVEEPEELHAEAEDIELPAEDKSANKKVRIPIWEIRLLALLGTLTFVGLTVLISLMAFVVLGRISPTLMTFASFAYLGGILAIYDLVQTLRGTKVDARLSWDWQHFSFRRFMVLFTVQFTMFPPTMLTFILHSKDLQFGSFLTRRATRETFTAHLVAFIWVAVGGLANFGYMRYRLKRARWFKRDRCLGRWSAKVLSLFIIVGVVFSLYSTIMGFLQEFNSGTAFFGILYLVMSLLIIHNCAVLLVRNRLNEKWYLRYRVWNGGHLFAAWSSFWVTLTIISLAASNVSGFWVGVNSLPGFHRSIIYSYMFAMFFFTLVTLCRGFLAKLDKRGRMPRILKARVVDPKTVEQCYCPRDGLERIVAERGGKPSNRQVMGLTQIKLPSKTSTCVTWKWQASAFLRQQEWLQVMETTMETFVSKALQGVKAKMALCYNWTRRWQGCAKELEMHGHLDSAPAKH